MKECKLCREEKSLDQFNWTAFGKRKNSYCKFCQKDYDKRRWQNKSGVEKLKLIESSKDRKRKTRQFLYTWYKTHPCVDCGETDPIVLQSDHVEKKSFNVSKAACDGISIQTLLVELDKCQVRCANCHMRKTANQFNWYKDIIR